MALPWQFFNIGIIGNEFGHLSLLFDNLVIFKTLIYQFNLNGEIKYIRGLSRSWPHPAEWLKRTDADDWVFYSVGGYNGIYYLIGEYYLPCLPYRSNSIWTYNPFMDSNIQQAFTAWTQLLTDISSLRTNGVPPRIKNFLSLISRHDKHTLNTRSK